MDAREQFYQLVATNRHTLYIVCHSLADLSANTTESTSHDATGAIMFQYRNKDTTLSSAQVTKTARQFVERAHNASALAIINDDPALAAEVNADGVHLGLSDPKISTARALLGENRIIGATCHSSLQLARRAIIQGADYVAFGSVFKSPTKPDAERIALTQLRHYVAQLNVPVCAIGGINKMNIRTVTATGADLIAVASAAQQDGCGRLRILA